MIGENILNGDIHMVQWHEVAALDLNRTLLLDVRQPAELEDGVIPGSVSIPLSELRQRLDEIPSGRDIVVYCRSGQRSYYAARILSQNGLNCASLDGSFLTWSRAIEAQSATL